jgi:hypothetical protein
MEKMEHFSLLKTLMGRQYSFLKAIQLLQENNVLDAPPYNLDCFLSRDTYIS